MPRQSTSLIPIIILTVLTAGCMPQPAFTSTPTKTPDPAFALVMATPIPSLEVTPESSPTTHDPATPTLDMPTPTTDTLTPEVTATPTATEPPPTPDDGLPPDHYWLERPIPADWTDYLDRTYAYGSTAGIKYRPHTGVEFFNPVGTPVIAVANATVVYAGTDFEILYGPQLGFYGNLIILQLDDYSYNGRPIYVLYGHLSEIYVEVGQPVPVREIIGGVGGTGVANGGAHLHFEVRLDDPQTYFTSTRNPDLWLKPYYGYGTLAGRVVNANGSMLREIGITVHGPDATRYTWTYAGDENIPDDEWQENFTLGDLPEGWYTITTRSDKRSYSEEVYIRSGRTSWLEFIFD